MLQGFFNYDNPVWRFVGRLGDMMLLNLIWFICCIPVFTIGASTTALYYCTLKIVKDEDYGDFRMFFKSFRLNFRQATIIWLILLAAAAVLGTDYYFFKNVFGGSSGVRFVLQAIVGAMLIIWLFETLYVFPMLSRFDNTVRRTMVNAIIMAIRYLGSTIGIIVLDAIIIGLVYLSFFYLPMITMILLLMGFPTIAWINSARFDRLFDKIMPKDASAAADPDDGTLRPILTDVKLDDPADSQVSGSAAADHAASENAVPDSAAASDRQDPGEAAADRTADDADRTS